MMKIFSLSEEDTDRLLRMLYNGTRPARVHTLICACAEIADLRVSPGAWDGWQILPTAKCPECLKCEHAASIQDAYPIQAHERFVGMVGAIGLRKAG